MACYSHRSFAKNWFVLSDTYAFPQTHQPNEPCGFITFEYWACGLYEVWIDTYMVNYIYLKKILQMLSHAETEKYKLGRWLDGFGIQTRAEILAGWELSVLT